MEIIIRTAAGEADISVVSPAREHARIADIITATTGFAPPEEAYVGDRQIATRQTLADAGVLAGDCISTVRPSTPTGTVVTLIQVAGPGAGSTRLLRPGRYRLGPGRRVVAEELAFAAVDDPVVTLTVRTDGSVEAEAHGTPGDVVTDEGVLGERPRRWGSGVLLAGQRAFLHRPATDLGPDFGSQHGILEALLRLSPPDEALSAVVAPDGTIPLPSADDGRSPARRWTERLDAPSAFQVMAGMTSGTPGPQDTPGPAGSMTGIPLNLRAAAGVGVIGNAERTRGAVRGIVLQLAAAHGPTDLRIVVATTSEQLRAWEWLKWLPHARGRYGPLLFTTGAELRSWHASGPRTAALTLLLTDDPVWWSGRDAALNPLIRADDTSVGSRTSPTCPVVMCGDVSLLPSVCDATLTIRSDGRGTLTADGRVDVPMVPVLPPEWVADDFARRMARYHDPVATTALQDTEVATPSLRDLVGAVLPAWSRRGAPDPPWTIPIGLSRVGGWVAIDPIGEGPNVLVAGGDETVGVGAVTESIVLSSAAMASPRDLAMVLLDLGGRSTFERCARLPHTIVHIVDPRRHVTWRLARWLRAVIASRREELQASGVSSIDEFDDPPFARLLIAIDELVPLDPDLAVFTDDVARVVTDLGNVGVHLLVGTSRPDALRNHPAARAGSRIALRTATTAQSETIIGVADAAGLPRLGRGQAMLWTDQVLLPFRPAGFAVPDRADELDRPAAGAVDRQAAADSELVAESEPAGSASGADAVSVRPFVIGRELSPTERRLAHVQASSADRSLDPHADELADAIIAAARHVDVGGRHPHWLPALPEEVSLADLLGREHLDPDPTTTRAVPRSVPFALVDRPDELDQRPLRWDPLGDESMLIVGGAAGEASAALRTLLAASATVISAEEARVHLVGRTWGSWLPDGQASDPAAGFHATELPHVRSVVDDDNTLVGLARELTDTVSRRLGAGAKSPPTHVLLVDAADGFHSSLGARGRSAWEQLTAAAVAGRGYGVCLVAGCTRPWTALVQLFDQLDGTRLHFEVVTELDAAGSDRSRFATARPGRGVIVDRDGAALDEFQMATVPPDPRLLPGWTR